MVSNDQQPQDLASILGILSQFAPASSGSPNVSDAQVDLISNGIHAAPQEAALPQSGLDEDEEPYEPPEPLQRLHPRSDVIGSVASSSRSVSTQPRAPLPDPTGIIDWPVGLRYVTRLAARNEALGRSVQRMIKNQRQNEREWWEGREILIQKQKDRVVDKEKLDRVLRSVGGQPSSGEGPDPATELKQYDKKVHRAQAIMVKAMEAELMANGVPFFGTQSALLAEDQPEQDAAEEGLTKRGKISKEDLQELQRRMLRYLEDIRPAATTLVHIDKTPRTTPLPLPPDDRPLDSESRQGSILPTAQPVAPRSRANLSHSSFKSAEAQVVMKVSTFFASALACTSMASAWSMPDSVSDVKALAARAEDYLFARQNDNNGDNSSSDGGNNSSADPTSTPSGDPSQTSDSPTATITDPPQSTGDTKSESNSSSGDNSNKSSGGSATATKGSSTKTSLSPIAPNDQVGGLAMITPAATAAASQIYKVGQTVTWVWNYTSLSRPPKHIDILASFAPTGGVAPSPFTLAVNRTFEPTQTFTWDTQDYYDHTSPLPIGTYTLVVYDADATAGVTQVPSPGYLGVWQQFHFAMYTRQPYLALGSPYVCATCNSAASMERMTVSAMVATAGMTVISFMWFTGGWQSMLWARSAKKISLDAANLALPLHDFAAVFLSSTTKLIEITAQDPTTSAQHLMFCGARANGDAIGIFTLSPYHICAPLLPDNTPHEEDLNERADRLRTLRTASAQIEALQPSMGVATGMYLLRTRQLIRAIPNSLFTSM
ncbi:hypothetical protein FH972_022227 [Carpinus fangiana]|uniref:DUF7137 domain-containing protein n=1 Tax=Carpinus fangiana TaxID=176857 RepID=A0A5N6KS93_9ROSI|nr:hypothetical protein FH972_022227 [Carpinus fangiana]